jgi:hypothetical protein
MMTMKLNLFLIMLAFASKENKFENDAKTEEGLKKMKPEDSVLVKIEEDEYTKVKKNSTYFGVMYYTRDRKWRAQRWSKRDKLHISNGLYKDEETAALASDTLARKLIANGEQNHKLNFPNDDTEVYAEKKSSIYFGVIYNKRDKTWTAQRRSKHEQNTIKYGTYKNEETAAHASDTLARELMANSEHIHKLNFPDNNTEVHPQKKKMHLQIHWGVLRCDMGKVACGQMESKREKDGSQRILQRRRSSCPRE